jgi:hypothetical protein
MKSTAQKPSIPLAYVIEADLEKANSFSGKGSVETTLSNTSGEDNIKRIVMMPVHIANEALILKNNEIEKWRGYYSEMLDRNRIFGTELGFEIAELRKANESLIEENLSLIESKNRIFNHHTNITNRLMEEIENRIITLALPDFEEEFNAWYTGKVAADPVGTEPNAKEAWMAATSLLKESIDLKDREIADLKRLLKDADLIKVKKT